MAKEPQFFQVERDGAVIIWKLYNPPRNLWNTETATEFDDLVEAFYDDPDLRVGIITSAMPDVFIQHFDVSLLVDWGEALRTAGPTPQAEHRAPRGIYRCGPKPIIAAINATAHGGGCELTLACDFRFMSRAATIGCPEVIVGILPPSGTQRMARLLGIGKALELILLGKILYADEAERIGLVHRACDPDELMPAVLAFANELATKAPLAVAHIKRCIYEGSEMPLEKGLELATELFWETAKSDEALEIMRAYVATGQDPQRLRDERERQEREQQG